MGSGGMGGWGMGPGAMGGWGMGPGLMGGAGPGFGAAPAIPGGAQLGLSADQRAKIFQIQKELRAKHWALMGKSMEARFRVQELYDADTLDKAAIDAQYKEIDDARRQMIDSSIDARGQVRALLTKEQIEKFDASTRGRGPGPMRRGN